MTLKNAETEFQELQNFKTPAPTARVPQDTKYLAEDTSSRLPLRPPTRAPHQPLPELYQPPFPNLAYPLFSRDPPDESRKRQDGSYEIKNELPSGIVKTTFGGDKFISLGIFNGRKEQWPRFIQTFRAIVDKQP